MLYNPGNESDIKLSMHKYHIYLNTVLPYMKDYTPPQS
jgi:hypothetical protein